MTDLFGQPWALGDFIRALIAAACLLGIALCLVLAFTSSSARRSAKEVRLAHIALPRPAFFKLMALVALFALPLFALAGGTYGLFVDTAKVSQCGSCHPMVLFVNDLQDPDSPNLAAQHYRNMWIQEEQCFHCHSDYGFQGTLSAKFAGVGHLVRYLSGAYSEPIELRRTFSNGNCLKCHASTPKYAGQEMHNDNAADIGSNAMSCTNCHDAPHPSKDQRTPGHPDYVRLMSMRVRDDR